LLFREQKMIKTAVIGASGFIGRRLLSAYRNHFPDCVGTTFSQHAADLRPFDIRSPDLASLRLEATGHEALLIASGKPTMFCERDPESAYAVNVAGVLRLIEQVARTSLSLIYLSTDYVFEGTTGGYADTAETKPSTTYGIHKQIVEREIPSLTDRYVILRLSKIYGVQKNDGTLLDEMARILAGSGGVVAAADQVFCPTEVGDLVRAIQQIQTQETRGLLNLCSPEVWSRHEIACAVADAMGVRRSRIKAILLAEVPGMTNRPRNTSMVSSIFRAWPTPRFTPLLENVRRVTANWAPAPKGLGSGVVAARDVDSLSS
jgi:dTDP-4-dehydrorhamnose reductase